MARAILYNVTFARYRKTNFLHSQHSEFNVATVRSLESDAFTSYHFDKEDGKHLEPDYAAIRAALPHQWRKAFDRINMWWFPVSLIEPLTASPNNRNWCSATLFDSRGNLIGSLYAVPYVFNPVTAV
jgi:hypothetical protein